MISLHKVDRSRQDSIWVGGIEYKIHTPFPYWIAFSKKIEGLQLTGKKTINLYELDYLYKPEYIKRPNRSKKQPRGNKPFIPEDRKSGYKELCKFFLNEQPLPRPAGKKDNVIGLDWLIDSEYIYAAFLQQYRIDLIKTDLHWHDFLALFYGLTGAKINEIITARYSKDTKGSMCEMRKMYEIRKKRAKLPEPEME